MDRATAKTALIVAVAVAIAAVGAWIAVGSAEPLSSVELSAKTLVARGPSGAGVVPASCPSYAHFPGECNPPDFTVSGGGGSGSTTTINEGDSATLTWECQNSSSSSGVYFDTNGQPSGTTDVAPADTTTYTLVCSNGGTGSVTVYVVHPELTIAANPTRVRSGSASTITWSSTNTNSCTVTGPNFSASGTSGSQSTGPLTVQSTYTLTCQTDGGSVAESVTVTLIPRFEEF